MANASVSGLPDSQLDISSLRKIAGSSPASVEFFFIFSFLQILSIFNIPAVISGFSSQSIILLYSEQLAHLCLVELRILLLQWTLTALIVASLYTCQAPSPTLQFGVFIAFPPHNASMDCWLDIKVSKKELIS